MKKLLLILSLIYFSNLSVSAATDNVLQSIQINSYKDTYNIILKSDEKPESKRSITDEDKITISLKGIRASEDLNTIYNAMNIDSVTVEPSGNDAVDISIQAKNVGRSNLVFDTLDTPLGVVRTKENLQSVKKSKKKITLNHPMRDYRPVYQDEEIEETAFSLDSLKSSAYTGSIVSIFKDENITNVISIMLIGLIAFCTVRLFRKNSKEDIQVGLTQSLKDRELGLMQEMSANQNFMPQMNAYQSPAVTPEMNYGIRSYQTAVKSPYQQRGMRSPYVTSDIPSRINTIAKPALNQETPVMARKVAAQPQMQQRPVSSSRMTAPQQKVTNLDSMKFLDSMAKIYEKNGRSDLAQGLKANINKVKTSV